MIMFGELHHGNCSPTYLASNRLWETELMRSRLGEALTKSVIMKNFGKLKLSIVCMVLQKPNEQKLVKNETKQKEIKKQVENKIDKFAYPSRKL